jgi:Protein of unknown function (DUF3501)
VRDGRGKAAPNVKPIERSEILGLADYETVRDRFRARVIAEKKNRRVPVGAKATATFENRDTVLMQIQEMLRTERITRSGAVQHEIDTYNELVPARNELSCTLMIEIPEKVEREEFLRSALGIERHLWLVSGPRRIGAVAVDRTAGEAAERTTAVQYLKFPLPADLADRMRAATKGQPLEHPLELVVDHAAYAVRTALPSATIASLGEDLLDEW